MVADVAPPVAHVRPYLLCDAWYVTNPDRDPQAISDYVHRAERQARTCRRVHLVATVTAILAGFAGVAVLTFGRMDPLAAAALTALIGTVTAAVLTLAATGITSAITATHLDTVYGPDLDLLTWLPTSAVPVDPANPVTFGSHSHRQLWEDAHVGGHALDFARNVTAHRAGA